MRYNFSLMISGKKQMDETTKALVEQSEEVLQETYKDIVSPSAKPIGIKK